MKARPLIRWAGSKRRLIPYLVNKCPKSFSRYVEPFCGSAALFFELEPRSALLADINPELINMYNVLKDGEDLYSRLSSLPKTKEEYYRQRGVEPLSLSETERAIRFLYLNRFCFNGVYRTNSLGKFNVPHGTKTGDFPPADQFALVQDRLGETTCLVATYEETLEKSIEGDFVYLDPPYFKGGRSSGEYGVGSFNGNAFPTLFSHLVDLDRRGVKFLLSYRLDQTSLEQLETQFCVETIDVKRHVAGFRAGWSVETEILAWNYA